jgi:IclR family acetate operon transcriptional repressor
LSAHQGGPGVLKFGMAGHLYLLSANRGQLVSLARSTNENAELAIFSGREVVIVDQVASPERLKGVTKVGRSFSLHASYIGKALLSALPPARAEDILPQELERFTDTTITDMGSFRTRWNSFDASAWPWTSKNTIWASVPSPQP